MKTIYKYPITTDDVVVIEMPKNAKILTVQKQYSDACIWAEVDTENVNEKRVFEIYGTGYPLNNVTEPSERKYIGTYQLREGSLVFHLYEIITNVSRSK